YLGIDQEQKYLEISKNRREELENQQTYQMYRSKIKDIQFMDSLYPSMVKEDSDMTYGDLPF
ncbi:MAG: site-specific DNA-methyltransferase, partial [Prevotella sp.]|nr:site-specific DNA-methyltransferase [Prevotella sp.]